VVPILGDALKYRFDIYAFVLSTNACMYRIAMDTAFNPKKELLRLLGATPTHPWAALIPQVLLWSFRRFCIEKLTLSEGSLQQSFCDDTLELVHMYCAKGLEVVSIEWFTPENIEQVSSPLEDYMKFFIEFCKQLDRSIEDNDDKTQDVLSEFLDESMGEMISRWVDEKHSKLLIFPMRVEDDDEFTEAQFSQLINALLLYSYKPAPVPLVPPAPPLPVQEVEEPKEPEQLIPPRKSLLWLILANAKPVEPNVTEVPEPPIRTVANAIARRKTLYKTGRRSQEARIKTRKTHPASY